MKLEDLRVPGYDIEELVGQGGMAAVYRARQQSFNRNVAIKILNQDLSDTHSFSERFIQESLIVARLNHSNIVQVYDVGEVNHRHYIAMEYLNGGDLATKLDQGLRVRDSLDIIAQTARALDFAHRKHIVHRDIKPANILFREDGAAVLTDFGIAKEMESQSNLTQTGLILGTPKYMSPEQIRGDEVDHRADIYSLGILFFRCLTNRVPFEGRNAMSTAYMHNNQPVPVLPEEVACFQPIINKMLAKNPADRYQFGRDIARDIELTDKELYYGDATNLDIECALELEMPEPIKAERTSMRKIHAPPRSSRGESKIITVALANATEAPAPITPPLPSEKIYARRHDDDDTDSSFLPDEVVVKKARSSRPKWIFTGATLVAFSVGTYLGLPYARQEYPAALEPIDTATRQVKDWYELARSKLPTFNTETEEQLSASELETIKPEPEYVAPTPISPPSSEAAPADWVVANLPKGNINRQNTNVVIDNLPPMDEEGQGWTDAMELPIPSMEVEEEEPAPDNSMIIEGLLEAAEIDIRELRLKRPESDSAYSKLQEVLELEPNQPQALRALEQIVEVYAKLANQATRDGDFTLARSNLDEAKSISPHMRVIAEAETKLAAAIEAKKLKKSSIITMEKSMVIQGLLAGAAIDEDEGRIRSPKGDNAVEKYKRILELDPLNEAAKNRLSVIDQVIP